ncbi:MAG: 2Fe-2S iron-sulfur cluster-binding protein [Syntrophorhabdales bacterium]|jgi:NADH dehydrogenase/NADH:ubiquinone oxidoreductase subunit G
MVRLTIDGKSIETGEGRTILEAAREHGIYIPTLCYHANLLSIGSCRICLVEVEGYALPMASCATAVQEGMSVATQSLRLASMRRDYLKLILAYHPLDCPICDAGGECDLQDLVFEHAIEKADYSVARQERIEGYATPLIKYFENRCVLCLRCIRACREISGRGVLDLVGTGIDARMAPTHAENCISCGECLSVCPVGALTENLSPVKARLWQVDRHFTTCPHCGFGCTFALDVAANGYVTDVIQDVKNMPNRGSLCVMGRFGYDFVNHGARIRGGMDKGAGLGVKEAASVAVERMAALDREEKTLGFVVSPRATNEEIFMLKEIAGHFRKVLFATSGFYHTGRVLEAYHRMGLSYPYEYDRLLDADLIIVAGANLLSNNHVLGDRVREAYKLRGSRIMVIDPAPGALAAIADAHLSVLPGRDGALFDALRGALASGAGAGLPAPGKADVIAVCERCGIGPDEFERARSLVGRAADIAVIFGSGISASDESMLGLLSFCAASGADKKGLIMPVARAANAVGAASILGAAIAPHELIANPDVKGIFFYEEDPFHYMRGETVAGCLQGKEFVLVADALPSAVMDRADLVVPTGVFTEKEGTFFAGDGAIRYLSKAVDCEQAGYAGFAFLSEVLTTLGGGASFSAPHDVTALMRSKGLIRPVNGREEPGADTIQEAPGSAPPRGRTGLPSGSGYILMVRDVFSNHHLAGSEVYSKGVSTVYRRQGYPVSEDTLFLSATDAAAMGLAEGDMVRVTSKSGSLHKPLSIKEGLRPGVLEYIVFRDRQEVLGLMETPAKWIEVEVGKG